MSEPTTTQGQKATSIKPMQVFVRGRIEQIRSHDGTRYTRIMTPAPDAYSRPQIVEVRGRQKLGERGDEVTVLCSLGGYQRKPYQFKNRDTGEVVTVTPVDMTLDVVEQ
ncbi:single-stranded DNA-binding protein [Ralstonia syzygii]|uniref:Single-stranded DNA-binding protein n=1 Tax=Ralstonia syzygii TaxID=28097 RepID=A0ABX7ZG08_9RALS|nr:single-stranded DNA-binding protein [Ralstonia syzygii]QUP53867.1 single-stranded DNA-binding protein [Ralstonia syzygii]